MGGILMGLRKAVIDTIKDGSLTLGGRVYQAFLAPADPIKPYATVKMADVSGDGRISFAGTQTIEVRLYDRMGDFINLDTIEEDIIPLLNSGPITDEDGTKFVVEWEPGGPGDFIDDEKKLIGRRVQFSAAVIHE
jgi:hypothetical protein